MMGSVATPLQAQLTTPPSMTELSHLAADAAVSCRSRVEHQRHRLLLQGPHAKAALAEPWGWRGSPSAPVVPPSLRRFLYTTRFPNASLFDPDSVLMLLGLEQHRRERAEFRGAGRRRVTPGVLTAWCSRMWCCPSCQHI